MATPNMNLALPTVSVTLGPQWATQLNAVLTQVDAHNHTSGYGVAVPTAGVSVNADFPFNGYNATALRTVRLADQVTTLAAPTDVGCLYLASGNLFFNSGAGVPVQITVGGGLAGTPGSIGGLASPAAVTYTSGNTTFRFTSNTNTNAHIDVGNVIVRQASVGANGVTIQSPNALAASYALTLPSALPAGQRILTVDNAGLSNYWNVDGSTVVIAAGALSVTNVTALSANTSAVVRGNRSAGDAGTDVALNSAVTRTAGYLLDVQNNGVTKFRVTYAGAAEAPSAALVATSGDVVVKGVAGGGGRVVLQGGLTAGDGNADVNVVSQATRTAGNLMAWINNATVVALLDIAGVIHGPNQWAVSDDAGTTSTSSGSFVAALAGITFSYPNGTPVEVNLTIPFTINSNAASILLRLTAGTSITMYLDASGAYSDFTTGTVVGTIAAPLIIPAGSTVSQTVTITNSQVGVSAMSGVVHLRGVIKSSSGSGNVSLQIASGTAGQSVSVFNATRRSRLVGTWA